jgi:hypothetical protein
VKFFFAPINKIAKEKMSSSNGGNTKPLFQQFFAQLLHALQND